MDDLGVGRPVSTGNSHTWTDFSVGVSVFCTSCRLALPRVQSEGE